MASKAQSFVTKLVSDVDKNLRHNSPVMLKGKNGEAQATIRYIGNVHFGEGEWIGIEFRSFDPRGKNDGQVDNVAYFQCKTKFGKFIRAEDGKLRVPKNASREVARMCLARAKKTVGEKTWDTLPFAEKKRLTLEIANMPPAAIKCRGELSMKGGLFGNYDSRWCVMWGNDRDGPTRLEIFSKQGGSKSAEAELKGATWKISKKDPCILEIVTKEKILALKAKKKKTVMAWMNALKFKEALDKARAIEEKRAAEQLAAKRAEEAAEAQRIQDLIEIEKAKKTPAQLFEELDKFKTGYLTFMSFYSWYKKKMKEVGVVVTSPVEAQEIWTASDTEGNGSLNFDQFLGLLAQLAANGLDQVINLGVKAAELEALEAELAAAQEKERASQAAMEAQLVAEEAARHEEQAAALEEMLSGGTGGDGERKADADSDGWDSLYYHDADGEEVEITVPQLRELIESGAVTAQTQVWGDNMDAWSALADVAASFKVDDILPEAEEEDEGEADDDDYDTWQYQQDDEAIEATRAELAALVGTLPGETLVWTEAFDDWYELEDCLHLLQDEAEGDAEGDAIDTLYYETDDAPVEVTVAEALELHEAGTIKDETKVWADSFDDWMPFSEVKHMFAGEKYDTIYYATDAGSSEELSVDSARTLVADGTISDDIMVWNEAMDDWVPFGECRALFGL